MWESDKKVLEAYKACFANLVSEMREGEEVDMSGMCVSETTALQSATAKAATWYVTKHVQDVPENQQMYYNPNIPYFQNL